MSPFPEFGGRGLEGACGSKPAELETDPAGFDALHADYYERGKVLRAATQFGVDHVAIMGPATS